MARTCRRFAPGRGRIVAPRSPVKALPKGDKHPLTPATNNRHVAQAWRLAVHSLTKPAELADSIN